MLTRDTYPRVIPLRCPSASDPGCDARSEALTTPAEKNNYKLLEGSAGAREVSNSEV
jgi:hypothetical protein